MVSDMEAHMEQRGVIKFLQAEKKMAPTDIYQCLLNVYRDWKVDIRAVRCVWGVWGKHWYCNDRIIFDQRREDEKHFEFRFHLLCEATTRVQVHVSVLPSLSLEIVMCQWYQPVGRVPPVSWSVQMLSECREFWLQVCALCQRRALRGNCVSNRT